MSPLAAFLLTFMGAAMIVAGIAVIYWPFALIVAGVMLLTVGLFGTEVQT